MFVADLCLVFSSFPVLVCLPFFRRWKTTIFVMCVPVLCVSLFSIGFFPPSSSDELRLSSLVLISPHCSCVTVKELMTIQIREVSHSDLSSGHFCFLVTCCQALRHIYEEIPSLGRSCPFLGVGVWVGGVDMEE